MWCSILISVIILLLGKLTNGQINAGSFSLTIVHLNDVHARFEETNKYSGRCTPEDSKNLKCYGGFPR